MKIFLINFECRAEYYKTEKILTIVSLFLNKKCVFQSSEENSKLKLFPNFIELNIKKMRFYSLINMNAFLQFRRKMKYNNYYFAIKFAFLINI